MTVRCLAQEHNTMSLARDGIRTAQSGVEHTNREATVPLKKKKKKSQPRINEVKESVIGFVPPFLAKKITV